MGEQNTAEILVLPVAEIGPGPLVRSERIDEAHAELLRPALDFVPPIVVRETGSGWSLIDGQHRLAAAKKEGRETIRAVVVALDDAEALEAAIKANTSHGKALTLSERKAAAEKLIAETDWSDRRIAAACGLHRVTVGKARPVDAGGRNRPRTGLDGKQYDAAKRAAERRDAEGEPGAEGPAKCTDGFDCPATPGADGLCAWHRMQRDKNAAQGPASTAPDADSPEPQPTPGENADPADHATTAGQSDDTDDSPNAGSDLGVVLHLPDDWRDRLANSAYLLGCPAELLGPALSSDDVYDLSSLGLHIDRVLEANRLHKEQTA